MKEQRLAYLFILPAVLVILTSTLFPILNGLTNAFRFVNTKPNPRNGEFAGLENFIFILGDAGFHDAIIVTLLFTILSVIATVLVSLGIALALTKRDWLSVAIRSMLVLPFAMSAALVGYTWRLMFNDRFGLFAEILDFVPGFKDANWLNDPVLTLAVLIASDVWNWAPFLALFFIAALLAVPRDAQEAARVDGANSLRVFRDVTLPSIMPMFGIVILLKTIFALKMFDQIYTLTKGAPGTQTLGFYTYFYSQKYYDVGGSAAISFFLIIPMGLLAWLYIKLLLRR